MPLYLTGNTLTIEDVAAVARQQKKVALSETAKQNMQKSYRWVREASIGNRAIYGVNTGFGSLARLRIPPEQSAQLSRNLIRSHAAGVGPIAPPDVTRAMMLLRANALSKGVSGCRPLLVEYLISFLNHNLLPVIPMQGSCGSSGDLAPLAHLGLVLMGDPLGEAILDGKKLPAPQALAQVGLEPILLEAKDGLAITNGAQLSTSLSTLICSDMQNLIKSAELAASMSIEALLGVSRAFHPAVHQLRPYRGAIECAGEIRKYIQGSTLIDSVPEKVQDAYSLRCTPQVLGAVRDTHRFVCSQISIELNAATDNPLILLDEPDENKAFSAGMFHGEPIGMAIDSLKIAICELASISERRLYRLTTGNLSQRLPPGLVGKDKPALGMMVPQTTAAALVSENKSLAWPASVDSIPTCEDQEDHIAMSTVAARRCRKVLNNARRVIAIELLTSAHALAYRLDKEPHHQLGSGTQKGYQIVHDILFEQSSNVLISHQIEQIAQKINHGTFVLSMEGSP